MTTTNVSPFQQRYKYPPLYFNNVLTKDEAIKRLLPMKLKDQYVFCTDKSLSFLKFKESREGEDDNFKGNLHT